MSMTISRCSLPLLAVLISVLTPTMAWSQNCAPLTGQAQQFSGFASIELVARFNNGSPINPPPNTLNQGAGMWNSACNASAVPTFSPVTSSNSPARVSVYYHGGQVDTSICSAGGCACAVRIWKDSSGNTQPGTIHLYNRDANGSDCMPIRSETIAHELGHVLNLTDTQASNCAGHIMYNIPLSTPSRSVQSSACMAADGQWETPTEEQQSDPDPGGGC